MGGEPTWQSPRVYKYRLRVSVPGREPYEADCGICPAGLQAGQTVDVAVSPRNHKRVTIVPEPEQDDVGGRVYTFELGSRPAGAERLKELAELGRLHRDGVLTDAEFAEEKARILGE
ncbi:SHOCT domain-containing protein [Actinomadura sp. DC4]|uniref:SHOCT domain-containing protein n=1 Tax=Actinomadura sp. DC4 TaxID=3055069 RepID=UPI0025AF3D6B|nr:SHOCT domain-containing protein [Actinomadura sp. DC4]MDN3359615.1 SHOCT domain-containing protein [Actinomadura sp. DC4]